MKTTKSDRAVRGQALWTCQVTLARECRVVEIGSALRTARERLGLGLAEVERETHIRGRYLAALEDERFELLPARAYAKGFLRVYAGFLGLEAQPLLAELEARLPEPEPELAPSQLHAAPAAPPRRISVLVAASLAVALIGVAAWRVTAARHPASAQGSPPVPTRPTVRAAAAPAPPRAHVPAAPAHLVLRARGPCWLSIRAESAAGPMLYQATLQQGQVLRYTLAPGRAQLWLRMGAPWNLQVWLNGKPNGTLPPGPGNVLVTRSGLRSA